MYGGVGVGKTMLMDLFVETAPTEFQVGMCNLMYVTD
jgi:predicted ATPase